MRAARILAIGGLVLAIQGCGAGGAATDTSVAPVEPSSAGTVGEVGVSDGDEYRVTGRLLRISTFCGTPPTPATPVAGEVRVYPDGELGYGTDAEPLRTTTAAADGTFSVTLPAGTYCLSGGGGSMCHRRLVVPDGAVDADVTFQQLGGGPCSIEEPGVELPVVAPD